MNTWWSAVDIEWCSYEELKHRKVVAQGWRDLGDLSSLLGSISQNKDKFVEVVQLLGDAAYTNTDWWSEDRKVERTPAVMWNLLNVRQGDLVVAVEGTTVKGICQIEQDAASSYHYAPAYEYAQTIGFPVEWVDWDAEAFGFAPTPPSRSILGLRGLNNESEAVKRAWEEYRKNEA